MRVFALRSGFFAGFGRFAERPCPTSAACPQLGASGNVKLRTWTGVLRQCNDRTPGVSNFNRARLVEILAERFSNTFQPVFSIGTGTVRSLDSTATHDRPSSGVSAKGSGVASMRGFLCFVNGSSCELRRSLHECGRTVLASRLRLRISPIRAGPLRHRADTLPALPVVADRW